MKELYAPFPERFRFLEEDAGHEATGSMRREASDWLIRVLKNRTGQGKRR